MAYLNFFLAITDYCSSFFSADNKIDRKLLIYHRMKILDAPLD